MVRSNARLSAHVTAFALIAACSALTYAQALKTINPPGGGTIVYGQVAGQTTEAGAMGAVLSSVHQNVGEKPQVGKLFAVHGTESVAVFFSATRRNGNGGQVGGMIIVTKISTDHVEAALITDEATRFHRTLQPNLKTLFAAWHPFQGAAAVSSSGTSGALSQLHPQVLPDRSAIVSLPDTWKIFPQLSGGGTICAGGPNGETAFLESRFSRQTQETRWCSRPFALCRWVDCVGLPTQTRPISLSAQIRRKLTFTSSTNHAMEAACLRPISIYRTSLRCPRMDRLSART
jgi:hypothetical protein